MGMLYLFYLTNAEFLKILKWLNTKQSRSIAQKSGRVTYIKLVNIRLTLWHTNFLANQAVQIDLQPKNRYNRNVNTPFEKCFFSQL
jgi:hypothetical protein